MKKAYALQFSCNFYHFGEMLINFKTYNGMHIQMELLMESFLPQSTRIFERFTLKLIKGLTSWFVVRNLGKIMILQGHVKMEIPKVEWNSML